MDLTFCSFSSGSSGNCYMVKTEETAILVDTGISCRKIFQSFEKTGTDPDALKAILITHEHSDHVKSLKTVTGKLPGVKAYANEETWKHIKHLLDDDDRRETFVSGEKFSIGDIEIKTFRTSHDAAEPVGFSFYKGGKQISIVTDTGYMPDNIIEDICSADLLVLEANHDVNVLQFCKYPYYIKRRILSDRGHLSNEVAAKCICRLQQEYCKDRRILLAHLSRDNNSPELAQLTVKNILEEAGIHIGDGLKLDVVIRDSMSALYQI